jgi:hypothetical protein
MPGRAEQVRDQRRRRPRGQGYQHLRSKTRGRGSGTPGARRVECPRDNARAYLDGAGFEGRIEGAVDAPEFTATATAVSIHTLDRARRILTRARTWRIPGQPDVEDYAEYRLLLPEELRSLVTAAGFAVHAIHDNREFRDSYLTGEGPTAPDVAGVRGRKLFLFASAVRC